LAFAPAAAFAVLALLFAVDLSSGGDGSSDDGDAFLTAKQEQASSAAGAPSERDSVAESPSAPGPAMAPAPATGAASESAGQSPDAGAGDTAIGEPEEVTPSSGLASQDRGDDDSGVNWLTVAEIGAAVVFVVSLAAVFGWPVLSRRTRI
jgi:hypothetical protein